MTDWRVYLALATIGAVTSGFALRLFRYLQGTASAPRVILRVSIYTIGSLFIYLLAWSIVCIALQVIIPVHGENKTNRDATWLIIIGVVPFIASKIVNPKGSTIAWLTSMLRMPLAATLNKAQERPLFFNVTDQALFENAKAAWIRGEKDATIIVDCETSAEARGRVVGAFLDAHRGQQWIPCEPTLVAAGRQFPILSFRLIGPVLLAIMGFIVAYLLRPYEPWASREESVRLAWVIANYIFGGMFAQDQQLGSMAATALLACMGAMLIPRRGAAFICVAALWTYVGLSVVSLEGANTVWNASLSVRIASTFSGWTFTAMNIASQGVLALLRDILSLSLSNVFGVSVIVWTMISIRITYRVLFHADGRLWYSQQIERPTNFGRID